MHNAHATLRHLTEEISSWHPGKENTEGLVEEAEAFLEKEEAIHKDISQIEHLLKGSMQGAEFSSGYVVYDLSI